MTPDIAKFEPYLTENNSGSWTASIRIPVIGDVAVTAYSHEEARMGLWLVSEAVARLARAPSKHPRDWTSEEWKSALTKMRAVMSP